MEKPAISPVSLNDLISRRWSPRAYDPTRPIESHKVLKLLEAARWAPSCFNEQPWRYLVFESQNEATMAQARSCLGSGNQWAQNAPLLLLSVAKEHFSHNDKPNRHAQHDVGMGSENLCLQAWDLGLISHQMAGFDSQKAIELFGIPTGYTPMAMIAVGYAGEVEELPSTLQEREVAPRQRKPLPEIAFKGHWGEGFPCEDELKK